MKRDMELVRKILFYIEDSYTPGQEFIREIIIDGYEPEIISEHIALIYEAGLVQDIKEMRMLRAPVSYWVGNLSNEGYDLLDKIRNDTIWNKTKDVIKTKGLPFMINTIKTVSNAVITAAAEGVTNSIMKNGGVV